MIVTVITSAAQVILITVSVIAYVFIAACLLPKIFLKPQYNVSNIKDRGLGRFVFDGGRAIVYQPSLSAKKYVDKYILSSVDGEKYIKCKLNRQILFIKYDVVAFDANDKVIATVEIKEKIKACGYSNAALLPVKTAYVSVIVKEVNGTKIGNAPKLLISPVKIVIFCVLEVIVTAVEALIISGMAADFLDSGLAVRPSEIESGFVLLTSLIAGIVLSAIVLACYFTKDTRIGK